MKATPPIRQTARNGFTLIELLVVITIIAILAGLSFPAGGAVINAARKAKAGATAQALASAITEYHLEYGRYPGLPGADLTVNTGNATGQDLLLCLIGVNEPNSNSDYPNPREVVFLDPTYSDTGRGGFTPLTVIPASGTPTGGTASLWDPWGSGFYIAIDGDYNNSLTEPGGTVLRKTVLVASPGKDQVSSFVGVTYDGTTPTIGNVNDDVTTW